MNQLQQWHWAKSEISLSHEHISECPPKYKFQVVKRHRKTLWNKPSQLILSPIVVKLNRKRCTLLLACEQALLFGRAYRNLSCAYQSLGDSQRAIEYHNQHISIAKEIGDRAAEGCGYGNLGDAYESLSEFQRAIEYHNQHLSIAKEVGNRACQGKALAKLGFAYRSLNEFQRAIEYNNKYVIIAKNVGDRAGQGQSPCQARLCLSQP